MKRFLNLNSPLAVGRWSLAGLCSFILLGAAGPAMAQAPSKDPAAALPFRVFGKSFLRLGYSAAGTEFALDRMYLNVDWRLWDKGTFKINLEGGDSRDKEYAYSGGTLTSKDTLFNLKTRAAYLEIKDLLGALTLQMGQVGLPWLGYADALWGYRMLGTSMLDRGGYLTSADLGIALSGKLGGMGDWQLDVVNGEGWKSPELGYHKDYHGRVTLRPLAPFGFEGFFMTGAGAAGAYDPAPSGSNERNRLIAQVGYQQPGQFVLVADQLLSATDPANKLVSRHPGLSVLGSSLANASGTSVYGVLNLSLFRTLPALSGFELLGRLDQMDPDVSIPNNSLTRQIYGLSYQWHPAATTVLATETTTYQAGALAKDDQRAMLTTEVRY